MLNYLGQLGPLIGVHLYPDSDQPYYVKGMTICTCFMMIVAVQAYVLRRILRAKNREVAAQGSKGDGEDEGLVAQSWADQAQFEFML